MTNEKIQKVNSFPVNESCLLAIHSSKNELELAAIHP